MLKQFFLIIIYKSGCWSITSTARQGWINYSDGRDYLCFQKGCMTIIQNSSCIHGKRH